MLLSAPPMRFPDHPPLLKTKITVPPAQPELLSRPRLFELVDGALARPLTLIVAPPGFGKTTLITSWLKEVRARPRVAWLSLDEDDNDPARFLHALLASLQAIDPAVGRTLDSMLGSLPSLATKDWMWMLLHELADLPEAVVLVLGDYHVITNSGIDASMTFFIENLPDQLRLSSRLASSRVCRSPGGASRQQVTEISPEHLHFTFDEAVLFFRQGMGLNLSGESVRALETRTEGWIAGLQIAALSLQSHVRPEGLEDLAQEAAGFSGEHRYVIGRATY